MLAHKLVKLRIAVHRDAGRDFAPLERHQSLLTENVAGDADAGTKLHPILFLRHVIEKNTGMLTRIF